MAIPIRLLLANGKDQIDLVAQSIDMSVDRKASAFPTPDNMLKRFAIDTNTPQIKIEVNGIFVDDEGVSANSDGIFEGEPMRSAINFGAFFPTDSRRSPKLGSRHTGSYFSALSPAVRYNISYLGMHQYLSVNAHSKGQTDTIIAMALPGSHIEFASSSTEQLDINPDMQFKATSTFSTSDSVFTVSYTNINIHTGVFFVAEELFLAGDKLIQEDGTEIGIVQSVSGNTITCTGNLSNTLPANSQIHIATQLFNHIGDFVGHIRYIIDDPAIADGEKAIYSIKLYANNDSIILGNSTLKVDISNQILANRFHNQTIKLIPSLWLSRPDKVLYQSSVTHDSSMDSNLTVAGSSTMSTLTPRIGVRLQFDLGSPYTDSPIIVQKAFDNASLDAAQVDAVIKVPIQDIHTVDNPALEMANRVKAAFELSGDVVRSGTLFPGFTLLSLFGNVGKTLSDAFRVVQRGTILTFEQVYSPPEPILHPSIISSDLKVLFREQEFHSASTTPVESRKSAGDKAQDLIGIVSNADRTNDLLRGIQIPYDSLIQSTGVTGVARNFFLTFGEVPVLDKGSANNTRAASKKMDNLLLNMTGLETDDSPDSWFERKLKQITPNEIESLFGFLVGLGKDAIWLTLQTNLSSANDGGIRIIPEKLHVRYDAGNNYYAYTLELSASDFVIGV